MGAKRRAAGKAPDAVPAGDRLLGVVVPAWAVFAWAFLVHLAFSHDDAATAFFFGDGLFFLQEAKAIVAGGAVDAGLPYHPPLVPWLLVPLWWALPEAAVVPAAKALMALANAATTALLYRLLRHRLPYAAPFALLLPLGFGELMLSATPNGEAVYRLLLAGLLGLGLRRPLAGGVLHGLAVLARPEHLGIGVALLAIGLVRPERRCFAAVTAAAAAVVVVPVLIANALELRQFNRRHAAELPEPLPVVVPVSFYGPLNFALAQREDDLHFSRRSLPPARGGASALDPLDPAHNAVIVHGYRLGLEAIAERPGRFVARSFGKMAHSLRAFVQGWTWQDLPKGREWTRRPVDMASASRPAYEVAAALLMAVGAWSLRRDKLLLGIGFGLIAYRLAINVMFFPYLRSMAIVAPFATLLLVAGLATLADRHAARLLAALVLVLGLVHVGTALGERRYAIAGERDASGSILEDRTVRLRRQG